MRPGLRLLLGLGDARLLARDIPGTLVVGVGGLVVRRFFIKHGRRGWDGHARAAQNRRRRHGEAVELRRFLIEGYDRGRRPRGGLEGQTRVDRALRCRTAGRLWVEEDRGLIILRQLVFVSVGLLAAHAGHPLARLAALQAAGAGLLVPRAYLS